MAKYTEIGKSGIKWSYGAVNEEFLPVTESCVITEVISDVPWSRLDASSYMLGYWSKTFLDAENIYNASDNGEKDSLEIVQCCEKLINMLISHDGRVQDLAKKYFTLKDIININ